MTLRLKPVPILFGLIVTTGNALPSLADSQDDAIKKVILSCPSTLYAGPCDTSGLIAEVLKVRGVYAKASVRRADSQIETDIVYLMQKNGRWVILDEGTGVNPEELGIPREAW